jgi:hypothetical protein
MVKAMLLLDRKQLPVGRSPCYAKVGRMHRPDLGLNPRTEPCVFCASLCGLHMLAGDR